MLISQFVPEIFAIEICIWATIRWLYSLVASHNNTFHGLKYKRIAYVDVLSTFESSKSRETDSYFTMHLHFFSTKGNAEAITMSLELHEWPWTTLYFLK